MDSGAAFPDRQTTTTVRARVRDVVHDVVVTIAPEELPLIAELNRHDDAVVVRRLGSRRRSRTPLGFGLTDLAALTTPVAWLALNQAEQQIVGHAVDGVAKGIRAVLAKVFRRRAPSVTIPPLTTEQLGQVRRLVLEMGMQRGLGEKRASVIADAVVARLVLAPSEDPGHKPHVAGHVTGDEA